MTPTPQIREFIKGFEKLRLVAYKPTPNDVWTIGYGATGTGITQDARWTEEQSDDRFARDVERFSVGVRNALDGAVTDQDQFDAMVSFAFNVGIAGFTGSTLLKRHKAGRYADAVKEFAKWNKQTNKTTGKLEVLNGLTRRRGEEAGIYQGKWPK